MAVKRHLDEIFRDSVFATFIVAQLNSLKGLVVLAVSCAVTVSSPNIIRPIPHYARKQESIEASRLPLTGSIFEILRSNGAKEQGLRYGISTL
jgi:hypothetical protein